MSAYRAVAGARLEPAEPLWVAYSPASGQTHVLNDECAAMLEWLLNHDQPADSERLAVEFAADTGVPTDRLAETIELAWVPLKLAGLVRQADGPCYPPVP